MTISESRDTSSHDVYAERSQARRESVKDSPTKDPKTMERVANFVALFFF